MIDGDDIFETSISTRILTRIIVGLIAAWSFVVGVVLAFFHGAASGALGAGVEDVAGQRLVGAHVLVLVPVYALIAWKPERFPMLHWLPFAGQAVIFLTVGYDILAGATEFSDGILPVAVSGIFLGLLAFIWITEQRAVAKAKLEAADAMDAEDDPEDDDDDDENDEDDGDEADEDAGDVKDGKGVKDGKAEAKKDDTAAAAGKKTVADTKTDAAKEPDAPMDEDVSEGRNEEAAADDGPERPA